MWTMDQQSRYYKQRGKTASCFYKENTDGDVQTARTSTPLTGFRVCVFKASSKA